MLFVVNPVFQPDAVTQYNVFERDIAVINIFFGKTTAIGKLALYNSLCLAITKDFQTVLFIFKGTQQ